MANEGRQKSRTPKPFRGSNVFDNKYIYIRSRRGIPWSETCTVWLYVARAAVIAFPKRKTDVISETRVERF